ncbi:MAG: alanine racemase [Bacteroidetes bacterium]|nr:MAG: alanine racemase [Bacteroidota bacterium]
MKSGFHIPSFLIDEIICRSNIHRMAQKALAHGLIFRPHFKTHQSVEVGEWFKDEGIRAITVSSLTMAAIFADAGWNDITIAFPMNIRETDGINHLAGKIRLNLLFDMPQQALVASKKIAHPAGYFIKADVGYHRSGVEPNDHETIQLILKATQGTSLTFKGFLTHSGNTYHANSRDEILGIHNDAIGLLHELKLQYQSLYPEILISIGDTPSCSIAKNFTGIDEIRPGNFAYFDLMQYHLGSCGFDEIAAAVICPVISVYPRRNQALIYGGAVHLSKESIISKNGDKIFGLVVPFISDKWENPQGDDYLVSLSQEHGIFTTESQWSKSLNTGDIVAVIPVHSCLAADLLKK